MAERCERRRLAAHPAVAIPLMPSRPLEPRHTAPTRQTTRVGGLPDGPPRPAAPWRRAAGLRRGGPTMRVAANANIDITNLQQRPMHPYHPSDGNHGNLIKPFPPNSLGQGTVFDGKDYNPFDRSFDIDG